MSSISRNRRSISKQRGAEMSSRLIPPKTGAIALTIRMISSTSLVSRQIGNASTPANSLNRIALPSITGSAPPGPMSPSPSTALPSETTATVLRLIVRFQIDSGIARDRPRDTRDARRIRHREIVTRLQRHARAHLELAAQMAQERAVRDRLDLHASERIHRRHDALDVRLVLGQDRDVAHLVPRSTRTRSIAPSSAPSSPIAVATRAKAPGLVGQTNPQDRAERRRNVRHAMSLRLAASPPPASTGA